MWALANNSPFAAERSWIRDYNGAEVWLVAVKGTYVIQPDGKLELASRQEDVYRVPIYSGKPGLSSLLYESDLVHTKAATDVILHGQAYAPNGAPATQVDVTMRLGEVSKTLRVVGDRGWKQSIMGLTLTEPEPFLTMPLCYERSFGGTDRESDDPRRHGREGRNPVGVGFAMDRDHLLGQSAPNIEHPGEMITSWKQRPRPAGFGPIARDWSPRVELSGTYDDRWEQERFPLVPADFDERHYLCAPEDQQFQDRPRGGEEIELRNMTPAGVLRFRLPRVAIGFETHFTGGESKHHRGVLHTIILEPEVPRLLMVWHSMLPCHTQVLKLEKTVITVKRFLRF
jgi:hypothetical protein